VSPIDRYYATRTEARIAWENGDQKRYEELSRVLAQLQPAFDMHLLHQHLGEKYPTVQFERQPDEGLLE